MIGIFYVFCSYAGVVGWGPNSIAAYTKNTNPWDTMAQRVWGPFHIIVILAILNSALGNANAGVNAASRMLYAMGRVHVLPTALARLNRFGTPGWTIIFVTVIAIVFSLLPGLLYGPTTGFAFMGATLTIPIILVYLATCVAVPCYYLRWQRHEFNVLRHIVVPVVPFIILLFVLYFQFSPLPAAPLSFAGPIVLLWLVIGIIIVALLSVRAPDVLEASGKVYGEEGM
jgi:amino acid transporter